MPKEKRIIVFKKLKSQSALYFTNRPEAANN